MAMVGWQILDRIGGTKYILLIKEYGGSPVLCSAADAAAADDLQVGAHPGLLRLRHAALLHGFPSLTAAATVSGLPRRPLPLRLLLKEKQSTTHVVVHPSSRALHADYIQLSFVLLID